MKDKKRLYRYTKKATVPILALAILLTAALIPIGAGPLGAYAADSTNAQVSLTAVSVDKLNDIVILAANLDAVPEDGISAVEFRVDYPNMFELVNVEDRNLMGENDKSTGFEGEAGANPYYIAFGSMDQDSNGVSTKTGELARFTFKVKDNSSLTASVDYNFKLTDINAFRLTAGDSSSAQTEYIDVSGNNASYIYIPVASDITGSIQNGNITVSKPTEGIAKIKTETVREAVSGTSSENIVLDMKSASTADSKEQIIISREGAQIISNAGKNLIIKTDAGQLSFDENALMALKSNAEDAAITISVEKRTNQDSEGNDINNVMNLSIGALSNGKYIKGCGNGIITVDVDIPSNLQGEKNLNCMLYDLKSGQYKMMEGAVSEDNTVYSFRTNRFSEYMIGAQDTLDSYVKDKDLKQGVKVSGQIQSYNPKNDITVQLKNGNNVIADTVIAGQTTGSGQKTQAFSVEAVPEGTYDLVVTKAGHLTYTIQNVIVGNEDIDLASATDKTYQTITLLAGDLNGDGKINNTDLLSLRRELGKSDSNINNIIADITGDNKVNNTDLLRLRANLGKTSKNNSSVDFK